MIQKLNGRTMLQMQCLRGKPYDLLACQSVHLASEAVQVFVVQQNRTLFEQHGMSEGGNTHVLATWETRQDSG